VSHRHLNTSLIGVLRIVARLSVTTLRSFFPPRPIAPFASLLRIELLAAELSHELLRVLGVGKAIDVPPLVIMEDRVTTLAEGRVLAEHVNDVVAAIERYRGRQRDLVRPPAIYTGGGKLAFAVHHAEGENEYGPGSISRGMEGTRLARLPAIATVTETPGQ
jgi:hypothetical protein